MPRFLIQVRAVANDGRELDSSRVVFCEQLLDAMDEIPDDWQSPEFDQLSDDLKENEDLDLTIFSITVRKSPRVVTT